MMSTSISYILYGIKNCDTIKKARQWLDNHHIIYQFHDYRTDGISIELLEIFIQHLGWEALINKRGMTWKKLSDEQKANIIDVASAKELMLKYPAIIKRPLLTTTDNHYLLGFSIDEYQRFMHHRG
ncbi:MULTISPECIES: ArsC family reductase [Arsenophonus]|uniref:ArsC family reductase n=1 Tax=Arsenophonus apicola TaxID=2879119 RepID=A0ABY8P5I6_9GAMM|nr:MULTISPECIES: ArsC family reductase [Arsenophonus]UBX30370.1 ArsC family reductase [Arsenophonus apicola]WGO84750.1 ArsC family reductase [Arsenophonus apicola]